MPPSKECPPSAAGPGCDVGKMNLRFVSGSRRLKPSGWVSCMGSGGRWQPNSRSDVLTNHNRPLFFFCGDAQHLHPQPATLKPPPKPDTQSAPPPPAQTLHRDRCYSSRSETYWGYVCPARAWHATFVLSILSLALSLSPPREVPQTDRTGPQTFPAKHVWAEWLHHPCLLVGP